MISQTLSILLSTILSFNLLGAPNQVFHNASPVLSAHSAMLFDLNTHTIVYQKNSQQTRQIARLTKLMTLYIILQENSLQQEVTLNKTHKETGGSTAYLKANRTYSVEELIKASLLNSANEAAMALAQHNAGSIDAFIKKMNIYAQKLGLKNTHFQNPIGFDHIKNYSTAYDLTKLTLEILKNQNIIDIASQTSSTITDNKNQKYQLHNTNKQLHNQLNLKGLKTGTTPEAGQCLIGITKGKKPVLTIILNSQDRFLDTNSLIEFSTNFK